MMPNHDAEIRIEKELTRLSTSFESLEAKIDDIAHAMKNATQSKELSHSAMWDAIGDHGRSLSWIKGISLGVQIIWAFLLGWVGLHKN